MPDATRQLILGGARSGKSGFAERQALALPGVKDWLYVATATAGDAEMAARIRHHRETRDCRWQTIEAPIDLASIVRAHHRADQCILVDCLTLWLSNCLDNDCWETEREAFMDAVANSRSRLLLVSNEVGSGVVPLGEMSRRFVDASGRLHQRLARLCERVTLVVAGLPLELKSVPDRRP